MKSNVNLQIANQLCLTKLELSQLKIRWQKKKPKHKIASSDDYISTHHINVANGDNFQWSGTMRKEKCKYKIWHLTTYVCH